MNTDSTTWRTFSWLWYSFNIFSCLCSWAFVCFIFYAFTYYFAWRIFIEAEDNLWSQLSSPSMCVLAGLLPGALTYWAISLTPPVFFLRPSITVSLPIRRMKLVMLSVERWMQLEIIILHLLSPSQKDKCHGTHSICLPSFVLLRFYIHTWYISCIFDVIKVGISREQRELRKLEKREVWGMCYV